MAKLKPKNVKSEYIFRETEIFFNDQLFKSDFRKFVLNSDKSISQIGRELGICRMSMSRYFKSMNNIKTKDFMLICNYIDSDLNKYFMPRVTDI